MKKTVLITGASRGIGKAIALRYAGEKYNTVICSRDEGTLAQTAADIRALGADCLWQAADVADYTSVAELFSKAKERFGRIDVVVNNAGISHIGLLQDMEPEQWNRIINVNLTSIFHTCKCAIPDMVAAKSGSIINISSMWGLSGASCEAAYSASKGGVNAFTKALAKELAPSGINVNAIACGVIDTDMNRCFTREERDALIGEIPAGRMGTPAEVAELVFSVSEGSPYLTGQIIALEGGYL